MRHEMPPSSRRLKIVGAAGASSHLAYPPPCLLVTNPCEVEAWKKERLQNVCDGTPACQASYTAKFFASVESTGSISAEKEPMICASSAGSGALPFLSRS